MVTEIIRGSRIEYAAAYRFIYLLNELFHFSQILEKKAAF